LRNYYFSFASQMKAFEQLRIIFFGTPEFAVASLDALLHAGAKIVAVVTAPDRPAGRGMQLQESGVKQYALSKGLPVLQPEKMKSPAFLEVLHNLNPDLQVVVAFRMMPEVVWNMPPMGTINVHGSLLPQYRGAAPINRAIINGEAATGVTTFKLKHEIDTGDILLQEKVAILSTDNAGSLHDKLMKAGAELLVRTVKGLAAGTIEETPQVIVKEEDLKYAPKIFKQDMIIDWNRPVKEIDDLIRGMAPYPGAQTMLGDRTIKIFSSDYREESPNALPGTVDTDNATYVRFAAADGWLYVDELQQEGKKKLSVVDFLRGYRDDPNA
jgi:methionyl-tRNA formyltransferase